MRELIHRHNYRENKYKIHINNYKKTISLWKRLIDFVLCTP